MIHGILQREEIVYSGYIVCKIWILMEFPFSDKTLVVTWLFISNPLAYQLIGDILSARLIDIV